MVVRRVRYLSKPARLAWTGVHVELVELVPKAMSSWVKNVLCHRELPDDLRSLPFKIQITTAQCSPPSAWVLKMKRIGKSSV